MSHNPEREDTLMLNLFTTPLVEIQIAFRKMGDGAAFQNPSSPYSFQSALEHLTLCRDYPYADPTEPKRTPEQIFAWVADQKSYSGRTCGATVYGDGGHHRYFLLIDGGIAFSRHHCHNSYPCAGVYDKAASLGFELW